MRPLRKRVSFRRWSFAVELGFPPHWAARLSFDDEASTISLGCPLGTVYVTAEGPGFRREESRAIGVSLYDGHLHWTFWMNPMCWSSDTPRWRDGGVDVADLVLGKCEIRIDNVESRSVWVPMIERSYLATATVKNHVRRWPRWPWAKTTTFVNIDMAAGYQIPVPGKGENSYDCGEDAVFGMATPEKTIEAAIGKVVGSVLETRKRHGWTSWDPPITASS